ncbi:MAG: TIGR01777 family protein [Pyrinomonadaceae bacterium]|nr:TIGR01777 family protein [Pyrinomonadaceae bacterium]
MKILITGASGLVGKHLAPFLRDKNHDVFALVRKPTTNEREITWNAEQGFIESELRKMENADAVIHLAGAGIADERWSKERKREIRDSRVTGTRVLVDGLAKLTNKPKTFVCASAIGYYGNRGDDILTEDEPPANDFLGEVSVAWERESSRAETFGMRVVNLRIGIILTPEGGALERMLTPFKMGVGGRVGSGKQFISWIALDDVVRALAFAVENENLRGAVNATAPNPVRNIEFTEVLGKTLNRPTIIPTPEFALRLMFGELADALLFSSTRVVPTKLLQAGFNFEFENVENALRHLLR